MNEFLSKLDQLIDSARDMVMESPKLDVVQNIAISSVEGFFYSNIIINYKNNLTDDNLKELDISKMDVNKIEKKFKDIFNRCYQTLEADSNEGKIDSKIYQTFKKDLNNISNNAYKLLLELENHIDMTSCENRINHFKKEVIKLGKELKIGTIRGDNGSIGLSIGFGDEDEEI